MSALEGMTQARWNSLTPAKRDAIRSDAGLSPQLIGLELARVDVGAAPRARPFTIRASYRLRAGSLRDRQSETGRLRAQGPCRPRRPLPSARAFAPLVLGLLGLGLL